MAKYSITLTDAAITALDARTGTGGRHARSTALARLIERYGEVMRDAEPKLSKRQWATCAKAIEDISPPPGRLELLVQLVRPLDDRLADLLTSHIDTAAYYCAIIDKIERQQAAAQRDAAKICG